MPEEFAAKQVVVQETLAKIAMPRVRELLAQAIDRSANIVWAITPEKLLKTAQLLAEYLESVPPIRQNYRHLETYFAKRDTLLFPLDTADCLRFLAPQEALALPERLEEARPRLKRLTARLSGVHQQLKQIEQRFAVPLAPFSGDMANMPAYLASLRAQQFGHLEELDMCLREAYNLYQGLWQIGRLLNMRWDIAGLKNCYAISSLDAETAEDNLKAYQQFTQAFAQHELGVKRLIEQAENLRQGLNQKMQGLYKTLKNPHLQEAKAQELFATVASKSLFSMNALLQAVEKMQQPGRI